MKKLILLLTLTMMFGQTKLETRMYEFTADHDEIINIADITGEDLQIYFVEIMDIELSNIHLGVISPDVSLKADVSNSSPFDEQRVMIKMHDKVEPTYLSGTYFPSKQVFTTDELKIENSSGSSHDPMIFKVIVTAEFSDMDTGYIEDGFDYCVEPGANLMSYPCDSDVALLDAIPADALSQFSGIIGQGLASVQLPNGTWVGSLTNMQASSGYWITSTTSLCFNYDCSEN